MKKTTIYALTGLTILFGFQKASAQTNPQFNMPQLYNPALVGTNPSGELNFATSFSDSFNGNRSYLGFNKHVDKLHGGLGVYTSNSILNNGKVRFNTIGASYAFQQSLGKNFTLSAGLGLSYGLISYPISDSLGNSSRKTESQFKANAGLMLYSNRFFVGASRNNLYMGYKFTPIKGLDLDLTPIISYNNGRLNGKLNLDYKFLHASVSVSKYLMTASAGVDIKQFTLGYSRNFFINYPYPSTPINSFSLKYRFKTKKETTHRAFNHLVF